MLLAIGNSENIQFQTSLDFVSVLALFVLASRYEYCIFKSAWMEEYLNFRKHISSPMYPAT